ncbi:unnamed protein product [Caenorhabditis sp. 36 PRJEB53466]|nr:unnamed protein product [Caenorhabditis sp. 36 PRJEB53466]
MSKTLIFLVAFAVILPEISAQSACNVTCWCNPVLDAFVSGDLDTKTYSTAATNFCTTFFSFSDTASTYCLAGLFIPYAAVVLLPYNFILTNKADICTAACINSNIISEGFSSLQSLSGLVG